MSVETILFIVECIGICSFSVSGTLISIQKKTDVIGALFFALLTCFGGGLLRDLLLGITPPHVLSDPGYHILLLICLSVSFVVFELSFIPKISAFIEKFKHVFLLYFTDAIGLSIFCVFGVDIALQSSTVHNPLLLIVCGCITGVGGGMLRDIVSGEIPLIFKKHIYLLPAILGSTLYVFTYSHLPHLVSMLLAIVLIIAIRLLAIIFKWNLPVPGKKKDCNKS